MGATRVTWSRGCGTGSSSFYETSVNGDCPHRPHSSAYPAADHPANFERRMARAPAVKAADIPAAVGLSVALKTAACVTLISPTPSTRVQGGPACSRQSTQDLMSLTVQAAIAAAAP